MTTPNVPATTRRDAQGLIPLGEVAPYFDGWIAGFAEGFAEGYAAGWEQRTSAIDTEAAQVLDAAARSIDVRAARAKPHVIPDWATPRPGVRS